MCKYRALYENKLWDVFISLMMHTVSSIFDRTPINRLIRQGSCWLGLDQPCLQEIEVQVPKLEPALVGLRIGHLSDFHIGPLFSPRQARRAIELLQSVTPDLIVVTGDIVDRNTPDVVPAANTIAGLAAPLGVFGVLGNHDHEAGSVRLLAALNEYAPHLRILSNTAHQVLVRETKLWIVGLDSAYFGLDNVELALSQVPLEAPCLLLCHEPDVVDKLPRSMTLTLAGHSHGGQICIRGTPLLLPPMGKQYHTGLIQSAIGPVYCNRGVGWAGIPLRWGCSAEVVILRLVPTAI